MNKVTAARRAGRALRVPVSDCPMLLTERASLDLDNEPQQPDYEEIVSKLRWTFPADSKGDAKGA